jgi:hypothetical protein
MQHQNKIIIGFVVLTIVSTLYWIMRMPSSLEPGMVKELEYVINQQAEEIESLKQQLDSRSNCSTE